MSSTETGSDSVRGAMTLKAKANQDQVSQELSLGGIISEETSFSYR